jgi:electron-transferring-flavoprotein dehydrogenase
MSELPDRESMDVDVVIVGAGPAGLAAAIRLKQLALEADRDISVTILEKGSEVGAHILSGAVIDPVGLNKLLPDWRDLDPPSMSPVNDDRFLVLGPAGSLSIPNILMPRLMSNEGCYVTSLGNVCRWLSGIAEDLGVEIYPGFAASEILYDEAGAVVGVATGDMGISRDGLQKDTFMRGMELRGRYTIFAEGARGQLTKKLVKKFDLDAGRDPQKYGLGIKELWEVDSSIHKPGLVQHTMGWPLDRSTGGGSFLYHFDKNLVSVGFVVHLNYKNPTLSPFEEFQRFKTHPAIRSTFEGGKRISYGARVITEGGFQSVPELVFPGGVLAGCAAGFVNVPRIKGSHNAILTGGMAAEAAFDALGEGRSHDELTGYQAAYHKSDVAVELSRVRNVKPLWSRFGTYLGIALGGIDMWMRQLRIGLPFTMKHGKPDHVGLMPVSKVRAIKYPKPDGKISFDRLSSVFLSGTNHEEDQPVHLQVADMNVQLTAEFSTFGGPSAYYCPAGVYEWVDNEMGTGTRLQINAQNCVHCKTCDIKDPSQNITWVAPEGSGGPTYPNM